MTSPTHEQTKQRRKQSAEELWERLAKDLFSVQTTLVEIIEAKAWEPLGYATFADAWRDRMSDISIAAEMRPHVVYQMLAEGVGVDTIADAVKGVGPDQAAAFKRQREHGVPADQATHIVREHHRRSPQRHFVSFEVDRETLTIWRAKAKATEQSVDAIAFAASAAAFEAMQ